MSCITFRNTVRPGAWVVLTGVGALMAALATTHDVAADGQRPMALGFRNESGAHATITSRGVIDENNPFFQELGTNGRSCFTCHQPAQAWSITPAELQERFTRTEGLDPIFRTNDGSTCEGADVSTPERRRTAFGLLLSRGVLRVALDVPQGAEFEIADVDDPHECGAPLTTASMFRRPPPTANLGFLSTVMWDGRETMPGHAISDDLITQARNATIGHAEGAPPTEAQLRAIVGFELGLVTAQVDDALAGRLGERGARGGPRPLTRQPFCIGVNDPLGMLPAMPGACAAATGFDPVVFTLFAGWKDDASPERQAIARGEALFNTRSFVISEVAGLNRHTGDPVTGPIPGTCTVCHDTPNAGNHSVAMPLDIGIADAARRAPDVPLYTLRHLATGETRRTTDPGRAMVTGKWADIGKFKGPVLRALAPRAPYFHDGSAASLAEVVEFYDTRFAIGLTADEKADLLAFLKAL